jgi:hypothetical protein
MTSWRELPAKVGAILFHHEDHEAHEGNKVYRLLHQGVCIIDVKDNCID